MRKPFASASALLFAAALMAGCSVAQTGEVPSSTPPAPSSSPSAPPEGASAEGALVPTGLVVAEPVRSSFWGLSADGAGALWWSQPGVTRFDPVTGSQRTFTIADDAVFGDVRASAPARSGGSWLVTSNALRLFDGQRFTRVVKTPASMGEVAEAPDGTVWTADDYAAAGAGVWSWDGSTWRRLPGGRPGSSVSALAVDAAGRVWVGDIDWTQSGPVGRGVSVWDGRAWTTYTPAQVPLPGAYVFRMTATPDGAVWVGGDTPGNVARFADGQWTGFSQEQTGMDWIQSIAQEPGGAVWFGGGQATWDKPTAPVDPVVAARFDGRGWTRFGPSGGLPVGVVNPTAEVAVANGQVWAATDQGVYAFLGLGWRRVLANEAGPTYPSRSLMAVSAEQAWIVDGGEGRLWHFDGSGWNSPPSTGRLAGKVNGATLAADGSVWAATDTGVSHFDGTRWTAVGPAVPIYGVTAAPDGTVWAGAGTFLLHLRGATVLATVYPPSNAYIHGLDSLAVAPGGDVWAVGVGYAQTAGPHRLHDGVWDTATPIPGRSDVLATAVTVGPEGQVWAALSIPPTSTAPEAAGAWDSALARFDGDTWTVYRDSEQTPFGHYVGGIAIGPDGTVYAASEGGLFAFDGITWTRRLPPDWWGAVSVAPDGAVWLSGDTLYRLPPR